MKDVVAAITKSKKAMVALAGLVVCLGAKVGLDLDNELVLGMLGLLGAYVLGQGVADHGKEAEKVKAGLPHPH